MSRKKFIDSVRVKDPCTQAWDEMVGNDKVRFCTHCAKDVNNLSAMTRKEAIQLVRKSGGSLCIRYVQQPRTAKPMFVEELTQITRRRAPLMAAGVVSATLSLASFTYAQGGAVATPPERKLAASVSECEDITGGAKKKEKEKSAPETPPYTEHNELATGSLTGTVVDPAEAVVPNTPITLRNADDRVIKIVYSDEDGRFHFDTLEPGRYSIQTDPIAGFNSTRMENIEINDQSETAIDITLELGVIVSGGAMISVREYEGALAIAVSNDDLDEARKLIAQGENVNYKEGDGTTPIFVAVENGNLEMVQMLLDAGAKINIRNEAKETPLMYLDDDATPELVNLMLRYGAKVNQTSKRGDTALIRAAGSSAETAIIQILVDAGADLNAQNEDGVTALMGAADGDDLENARVLVLAGANVNLKDRSGETAWDKTGEPELELLLETHGAIVEKEEDDTETTEFELRQPLDY